MARYHRGLAVALEVPHRDLFELMEKVEASLTSMQLSVTSLVSPCLLSFYFSFSFLSFHRKATAWQSVKQFLSEDSSPWLGWPWDGSWDGGRTSRGLSLQNGSHLGARTSDNHTQRLRTACHSRGKLVFRPPFQSLWFFLTVGCFSLLASSVFQVLHLLWLVTHLKSRTLDLKREAMECLCIGVGGSKAAAIWDEITGAFALWNESVIRPYHQYSSKVVTEDPFDTVDPSPAISHPLGFKLGTAPGYKSMDHIEAALHHMQIGVHPVVPSDPLRLQPIPDDPKNPASRNQLKATATQQWYDISGLPSCVALADATVSCPTSKEKTSATGIPAKYLSKWLTTLSPKESVYACTYKGCDRIFKQLAGIYNHLHCLHLGVAMGCYYSSGRWWTSKAWSDHHTHEHPLLDPYPSGAELEQLLMKKAQATILTSSGNSPSASVTTASAILDSLSSVHIEDNDDDSVGDDGDDIPPVILPLDGPSPFLLGEVESATSTISATVLSTESFGGACPHVPTAYASGWHKKVTPHRSSPL